MKTRIITAVVGIAVLIAVMCFFDTLLFDLVIAALTLLAMHEAWQAVGFQKKDWYIYAAAVPSVLLVLFLHYDLARLLILPVITCTAIFYAACLVVGNCTLDFSRLSSFVTFSSVIVLSFYSFVYLKYRLPVEEYSAEAIYFIVLILCFAWGGDTFAYFAGRFFGKHKLAPVVSPKKTIEGAIGGILGCVLLGEGCTFVYENIAIKSDIFFHNVAPAFYLIVAVLGVIAAILGILGDLFASVIKRQHGIKDYGTIFPGHGGILDRFDSVLFVALFVSMTVRYAFYFAV